MLGAEDTPLHDTKIAGRSLTLPSPKERVLKSKFQGAKLKSSPLERI
jgi:hypothetical protein